jgi:aspartyl-tRNA(Asn)/glutamyl-tRNA(Gln) amidotransferase subunit B
MEKGQMRVEANISVSRDSTLGTKTEVKNLNSFKSVERAIEFEIKRQVEVLESGGTLVQETRGFDEDRGVTFSQRLKESSHDYRYFPDPDIPKFQISRIPDFAHEALKASLPELPDTRRARYTSLGIRPQDVETLVADTLFQEFFDSELAGLGPKLVPLSVNYLLTDIRGTLSEEGQLDAFRGGRLAKVMTMVESGSLSSRGAKDLLTLLSESDEEPQAIAESKGLLQKSDSDFLSRIAEKVIQDNTKVVEEIRAGKRDAIKFLVGVGMRESKGQANPAELLKSIEAALG